MAIDHMHYKKIEDNLRIIIWPFRGRNMRSESKTPKHRPSIKEYKTRTIAFVHSFATMYYTILCKIIIRGLASNGLKAET